MTLDKAILRIFEARAKPGKAEALHDKFSGTSISVVDGKPGNLGYFFGHELSSDAADLVFVSVWESLDAIRENFGEDWQQSYLPDGYAALIERHAVRHVEIDGKLVP